MKVAVFLIAFVSGLLIFSWFREGYIMGWAEGALAFYDISRYVSQTEYAWADHPGLGNVTGIITASKPTYIFLDFLQKLNVPGFLIQALIFWFIFFCSGLGTYLFTKELFPKMPNRYLILSVFFYWFNPISLVNVWNRFLLNYIFFFGLLPPVLYIFYKGLSARKMVYVLYWNLFCLLFSYAFSSFVYSFLLWLFFSAIVLFYLFVAGNFKDRFFILRYYLAGLILFVLFNFWWITQLISFTFTQTYQTNITPFFSTEGNLGTLTALSQQIGDLTNIFRLINATFYRADQIDWVKNFIGWPYILFSFIVTGAIFWVIKREIKERSVLFLAIILFIFFYLSKGNNPPLGDLYTIAFKKITFFQVFRNSFEKFGFILPLLIAPLFALSTMKLADKFKGSGKRIVYFIFISFVLVVWGQPYFFKDIFTTKDTLISPHLAYYQVDVPSYYKEANQYLATQEGNFRFIGFPLGGEGITYKWNKGYQGVELPSTLFSTPGVMFNTSVPFYSQIVPKIENVLVSGRDINKLANVLNARYFIVRSDIDYKMREMRDPKLITVALVKKQSEGKAKEVKKAGELVIWENTQWKDNTFSTASEVLKKKPDIDGESLLNLTPNQVISEDYSLASFEAPPEVSYVKYDPTKYIVQVRGATAPFVLVFSQLYNPNWQASVNSQKVSDHIRVNEYANGWVITKNGSYNIDINFYPQRWLEIGQGVSIFSIVAGILLLIIYNAGRLLRYKVTF